jgi:hypothetical protein
MVHQCQSKKAMGFSAVKPSIAQLFVSSGDTLASTNQRILVGGQGNAGFKLHSPDPAGSQSKRPIRSKKVVIASLPHRFIIR